MREFRILLGLFLFTFWFAKAQDVRIEPPNWWVGMANSELQLLVKADDIGAFQVKLKKGRNQLIKKVHQADSPNYLFIDLDLSSVNKPEKLVFEFSNDTSRFEHEYELRKLEFGSDKIEGFNSGDAIYLITPDRFVNGDESNDSVPGLKEQAVDRSHDYKRHGGDIAGLTKKLEEGYSPLEAAIKGSNEILFAIISTSISLAAVFLPVIFMRAFKNPSIALEGRGFAPRIVNFIRDSIQLI